MKEKIKKWAIGKSDAILITGTGRNGTTYVARALKEINPNITVGHEIDPNGLGIQNLSYLEKKNYIVHSRGRIATNALFRGKRKFALIESNCYMSPAITEYARAWNHCKVIGIVRDWKSCITSMASQSFPEQAHYFYDEKDPQISRRPNPVELGLVEVSTWENYHRLEKIAWYWSYVNEQLIEYALKNPKSTLILDFKQLKSHPQQFLNLIQTFSGLPPVSLNTDSVKKSNWQEMNQIRISLNDVDPNLHESVRNITAKTAQRIESYLLNTRGN